MRKKEGDRIVGNKMVRRLSRNRYGYNFDDVREVVLRLGCRFQGVTSGDIREMLAVGERRSRQIIQNLEEAGDLVRTPLTRDQHRGRPPVIYRTNPDLFSEFS